MSNNQNTSNEKIKRFKKLFQECKNKKIDPSERVEFVKLIRDPDIILTVEEFRRINAMLKTMLEKPLDLVNVTKFEEIIKKLKGNLTIQFVSNPRFSIPVSIQQALREIITSKSYTSSPLLGEGGYGKVFLLNVSGQQFVLKEIKLLDKDSHILIKNEIEALKHVVGEWYAVQILAYAILTSGNYDIAYILYPYIPGETLDTYQKVPQPEEEEYKIYSDIIEGVELLHKKHILHSDIKPENIWIPTDRNIRPFLLDFGLIQSLNEGTIAKKWGTRHYWSTKRLSVPMTNQPMTPGINWIALAKTLGSELTNTNSRKLPHLYRRFKNLYNTKNENSIKKNNINRTLRGQQKRIINTNTIMPVMSRQPQSPRTIVRAPRTPSITRERTQPTSINQPRQNNNNNKRNTKKAKTTKINATMTS